MEPDNFENKKRKWIILGVASIVLLILIGFSFYLFENKNLHSISIQNTNRFQADNTQQFNDGELGVTFYFPPNWGDVQKSTTAHVESSPFDIQHQFNFSQNSSVIITANYLGEPDVFRQHAYYDKASKEKNNLAGEFCKANLEHEESGDNQDPNQPHSSFRQNGIYDYGVCNNKTIYFIKAQKVGNPSGLLTLNKQGNAKIKISKTYVIETGNLTYSPLEITVNLLELSSNDYAEFQWAGTEKRKSYSFITYPDKEAIDNAVKNFQNNELNKEVEQLVNSLSAKAVLVQDANNFIESYFKPKSPYSNDKMGIKFDYPSILPEPVLSKDEKSIYLDRFELVKVISRQDAVDIEKAATECTGMCFGSSITADEWDSNLAILTKGIIDKEKCRDCESIETVGNNKFLVLFWGKSGYGGHPGKRYISYQNGKRYEFNGFQNGFMLGTSFSLSEFNKMSDESIMQNVVKNIIGSVGFNK
jgi:hypothetical protein